MLNVIREMQTKTTAIYHLYFHFPWSGKRQALVRRGEIRTFTHCRWEYKVERLLRKQSGVLLKMSESPHNCEILLPRYLPERHGNRHSNTCTWVFTAALYTGAKMWTQSRCLSADEQMGSLPCATECCPAIKSNEALTQAMDEPWIQDVGWKTSHTKGDIPSDFLYRKCPEWSDPYRQEVDSGCQILGGGDGREVWGETDYWVLGFFCSDENIWKWTVVELLWWSSAQDSTLPIQGAQVHSLVRELHPTRHN